MLTERCFTRDYIGFQSRRLGARDPQLVEKCIMAFEIVGKLSEIGFDFVFKGGTSLLLHLDPPRRLSIDADLVTSASLADIRKVLAEATGKAPFSGYTYQDHRDRENPPTRYFQLYYDSPTQGRPASIQLDVQLADIGYDNLETKPIEMDMLEIEEPQTVRIPTIEGQLGDKLSAFAPSTIGVLYRPEPRNPEGRAPEPDPTRVLKHLFDVGELFAIAEDLPAITKAYTNSHFIQNTARMSNFSVEQCLDDSIDAAYHVAELGLGNPVDNEKTRFFKKGIRSLDSHLLGARFNVLAAGVPASRVAVLAALLRSGRSVGTLDTLRTMPDPEELKKLSLDGRFERLSKLWKTNPEAFYYWHIANEFQSREP
jgi:hypothetical protein